MITHNKGEWSELYVLLKLLGDGGLYAADGKLSTISSAYYPLVEILRCENQQKKRYIREDIAIKIVEENGNELLSLPAQVFQEKAQFLLEAIKTSRATFSVPAIEAFMQVIHCAKVKADSSGKSDITLVLHDVKTYRNETFDFSIKSQLGNPSTLLNASKATNFIFEVHGVDEQGMTAFNHSQNKLRDKVRYLLDSGVSLQFSRLESDVFFGNLQMIDTQFPLIASEIVLAYYQTKDNHLERLLKTVAQRNICQFDLALSPKLYEYKVKNFLTAVALGMMPASSWSGEFQANGGYIIVKEDGAIVCYHLYNQNEFKDYLFHHTRLETPSTSRHDFGQLYQDNQKTWLKLNLQIRFI